MVTKKVVRNGKTVYIKVPANSVKKVVKRTTQTAKTTNSSKTSQKSAGRPVSRPNTKKRRKHRKMSGKELAITIITVIVGISLVCVMGYNILRSANFFGGEKNLNNDKLNSNPNKASSGTMDDLNIDDPNSIKDNLVNVLVVGFDESRSLTDVIMVFSLDTKENTCNILQIPRDCYVGNWTTGKINSAFAMGGDSGRSSIQNLIDSINDTFMLRIDHYASIGCDDIEDIVDAMGGVEVNVPMTISWSGMGTIYEGQQTLDGYQAEILLRYRSGYTEGDIGRQKMQRIFFAGAVQQAKSMGINQIKDVVSEVWDKFETDMNNGELIDLAKLFLKVDMDDFNIFMVPGEGYMESNPAYAYENYYKYSIYSIHKNETANLLNDYFRPYQGPIPAEQLGIREVVKEGNYQITYDVDKDSHSLAELQENPTIHYE
jgi:LCP family protein required for cell wall assembly